mgnify:CR=1 FL=1
MPTPPPWSRPFFWTMGVSLIAAEGLAFWLLCAHQMDRQQARRTEALAVQMAFGDCLEYVDRSTIASCSRRIIASRR